MATEKQGGQPGGTSFIANERIKQSKPRRCVRRSTLSEYRRRLGWDKQGVWAGRRKLLPAEPGGQQAGCQPAHLAL